MSASKLRVALFSGNYNCVRDGANQALNRLVEYAGRCGADVRVYSATNDRPAFPPAGTLISIRSMPIPGRSEYRVALGIPAAIRREIAAFNPNLIHVAAPDILGHRAISLARATKTALVASMHTRFETYPAYYGMGFFEGPLRWILRRFYNRCDLVLAPSEPVKEMMSADNMGRTFGIWSRGVDTQIFNPKQRDLAWRRALGIADDELVIGYLGRLVLEKGIDDFAATVRKLREAGIVHRVMVIGDGPARPTFETLLPEAVFVGFQSGNELGRAVASIDVLLNPSTTEAFGNVMLEAQACGTPVVAARALGGLSLVKDGASGFLIEPGNIAEYARAIAHYAGNKPLFESHRLAATRQSEGFDWDRINQNVLDMYIALVRQNERVS